MTKGKGTQMGWLSKTHLQNGNTRVLRDEERVFKCIHRGDTY